MFFGTTRRVERALLALLLACLLAAGCRSAEVGEPLHGVRVSGTPRLAEPRGRLVVLGIDALPPDLIRRLARARLLPSFAELLREGTNADIDVRPVGLPPLSPRIWTTYVTGQLPQDHGILSFVVDKGTDREVLYDASHRKVPALWNIASQLGRSVGVVNWWATAPAEHIDGFVVSDLFSDVEMVLRPDNIRKKSEVGAERLVYPVSLLDKLRKIPPARRIVGVSPQRAEEVDSKILELARVAVADHPVDILLVYIRAFDELAHHAWHTHERRNDEPPVHDAIVDYLRRVDWLLGRFERQLGADDHLVVLSDHGFERQADPQELGGTHKSARTARALFLARGPRIRPRATAEPISAVDVLPILLDLAGLPAAENMPGRVPRSIFLTGESEVLARVESYTSQAAMEPVGGAGADETIKERLRALGYLEDGH